MNKFMANFKDTVSTICGYAFALGGAGVGLSTQIPLPKAVVTISYGMVAISGAIIGVLTGKAPDGSKKTDAQVIIGNIKEPPTGLSEKQ